MASTLLRCDQPLPAGLTPSPGHEHHPPRPPVPASDPRLALDVAATQAAGSIASSIASSIESSIGGGGDKEADDLFSLKPIEALQLLSASVELLVRITGDVPPTPPLATPPTDTQMSDMQVEKDKIARSHSEKSLAKLRMQALREDEESDERRRRQQQQQQQQHSNGHLSNSNSTAATTAIDGVRLKHEPVQFQDPPPAAGQAPEPYIIVGSDSQPINVQHGAITRRFYSRNEPPISVNQYLLRLHQFCPMSTAVYLAASLYIHRLAVQERAIPVTRRNAHRLVLAGLRVAMKALEDLSYSHSKVAKVGGVSEVELARLEINFCFLAGFELVVGEKALREHWELLRCGGSQRRVDELEMEKLSQMLGRVTERP
ncbi:PHO85 cyclin-7 [Escovopsis weberi]|uniref:PHO85 cyclin-7 n=1 Tax=Escovopsis weberi TaxID=150374 RepID=A0A0M9VW44_ESCWE|nr:PHO85 cyclin-7 [Escovopsis weberi]